MSQYLLEALIKATSGDARRELEKFDKALEDTGKKTEKAGKRVNISFRDIALGATAMAATVAGVVVAINKGLDALEKGAQLQQVETNFGRLAQTIKTDSASLQTALNEAARGMVSNSELMSSANMLITMGLADTTEELASLVEMATKLGRGGSASQNIADFASTLANQSIERLDTFGISSGRVRTRIDELIKSGQALNREQAFKMAVLEEGAKSMDRLGEQATNTASVVKAQFADMRDQLIKDVTAGIAPAVNEFSEETLPAMAEAARSAAPVVVDALTAISKQAELMSKNSALRQVHEQVNDFGLGVMTLFNIMDTHFTPFRLFRDAEDFAEDIGKQERATQRLVIALGLLEGGFTGTDEELVDLVDVMYAAQTRAAGMNDAFGDLQRTTSDVNDEVATQVEQTRALARTSPELLEQMERKNILLSDEAAAVAGANAANKAYFDAQRQAREEAAAWAESLMGGSDAIDTYIEALQDAEEAQGEWVTYTADNAGEIADINAELGRDLDDETKKTYRELLRTVDEGSAEWLSLYDALQDDLTDSQRDALVRQRADLLAQQGELRTYYTGDATAHDEAVARMRAAEQQLAHDVKARALEQLLASVATKEGRDAALEAAVQAGVLSEEEAELRQRYYDTTAAIDEVIARYNAGLIPSAENAANAIRTLTDLILGQISVLYNAKAAAEEYKAGLDAIAAMDITNPYGDSQGTGGITDDGASGGDGPDYRAAGGSVYAGSPYIVGERGPELFVPNNSGVVVPNNMFNAPAAPASGGVVTYNNQRQATNNMTLNVQTVMPAVSVTREFRLMQSIMGGI